MSEINMSSQKLSLGSKYDALNCIMQFHNEVESLIDAVELVELANPARKSETIRYIATANRRGMTIDLIIIWEEMEDLWGKKKGLWSLHPCMHIAGGSPETFLKLVDPASKLDCSAVRCFAHLYELSDDVLESEMDGRKAFLVSDTLDSVTKVAKELLLRYHE